jgi:hypothetical protein
MGTRGFIGFVADGKTKVAYCHWDAYPGGLGLSVLSWLHRVDLTSAASAAKALRVVGESEEPTDEDIARLAPYTDRNVGARTERPGWYQLLRGAQGDPAAALAAGVIEDASDFPADSLFAEWGFVVDFDFGKFEAYEGSQQEPHGQGRFANLPPRDNDYHPVKLVASWPLSALPTEDAFLAKLGDE